MEKLPYKIVAVLDETLIYGIALNTTAHMLARLGSLVPSMMGESPTDLSGIIHSGIPKYPNIILKATKERIREIIGKARQIKNLTVVDYPEAGLTTYTDDEFCQAVTRQKEDEIIYLGVALFGETSELSKLTGDLKLWR